MSDEWMADNFQSREECGAIIVMSRALTSVLRPIFFINIAIKAAKTNILHYLTIILRGPR